MLSPPQDVYLGVFPVQPPEWVKYEFSWREAKDHSYVIPKETFVSEW